MNLIHSALTLVLIPISLTAAEEEVDSVSGISLIEFMKGEEPKNDSLKLVVSKLRAEFQKCEIKSKDAATRAAEIGCKGSTPLAVSFTKNKLIYDNGFFIWEVRFYAQLQVFETMPYRICWVSARTGGLCSRWDRKLPIQRELTNLRKLEKMNSLIQQRSRIHTPKLSDHVAP